MKNTSVDFLFRILAAIAFGFFVVLISGCSGGSDNDIISARVVDMELQDRTISVGEGTVVQVDFSYDATDVFQDDNNVVVIIRLPAGVELRSNTSEIEGGIGGDNGVGSQVTRCLNGDEYLVYNLDRFDLDGAQNPSGDADARLRFTVDGVQSVQNGLLESRADTFGSFSCDGAFLADARVILSVI